MELTYPISPCSKNVKICLLFKKMTFSVLPFWDMDLFTTGVGIISFSLTSTNLETNPDQLTLSPTVTEVENGPLNERKLPLETSHVPRKTMIMGERVKFL